MTTRSLPHGRGSELMTFAQRHPGGGQQVAGVGIGEALEGVLVGEPGEALMFVGERHGMGAGAAEREAATAAGGAGAAQGGGA